MLDNTQIVLAEALSEDSQHFQSKTTKIKRKCTYKTKQSTISKQQNNSACRISQNSVCMDVFFTSAYFNYLDYIYVRFIVTIVFIKADVLTVSK